VGRFFSDELVDRVRGATDIVALVQESVALKRSGSTFKGLCPFHREKTPSFIVSPERQSFKCFGCGEGGDVFSFVMKIENVDFPEAVRILAERARVELPERQEPAQRSTSDERDRIFRVNAWAAELYHRMLLETPAGKGALAYLHERGVNDDTVTRFQLGFAPPSWTVLLTEGRKRGFSDAQMVKAGLLSASDKHGDYYDRFRNRLIFPIRDGRERVVGFGARALDETEPKYLNSPETPVFSKGRVLYGIEKARKAFREKRSAIIVEGYMDVIMAHQCGVTWTVGVLGTALTREHVRYLRRYVDEGVLVFDSDVAGQNSTIRSIDAFVSEELAVRTTTLPENMDPDDFLRRYGADAFIKAAEQGVDGVMFKLQRALDALPPGARESAPRLARALDDVLATVGLIGNPVTRSLEIRKIARAAGLPEPTLRGRMEHLTLRQRDAHGDAVPRPPMTRDPEQELLEAMLTYPGTIRYVRERLTDQHLQRSDVRTLVERLFALDEQGVQIGPEELLARTQEPALRPLVEAMIGLPPKKVEDPQAWCEELLVRLAARVQERASAEARSRVSRRTRADRDEEARLLYESLLAARRAQELQGTLRLREKP